MANQKVSALTALTGANVDALADVMPIVDTSVATTKKILVSELAQAMLVLGTAQATTAGTSIDFTGIPAWVRRITINFVGVSTNGTSDILVQIGDSGGIESSGYLSTVATSAGTPQNSAAGFIIANGGSAAALMSGQVVLCLENASTFTWTCTGTVKVSVLQLCFSAGDKATSAALDRVRITTVNGTDAFDAGAINILTE